MASGAMKKRKRILSESFDFMESPRVHCATQVCILNWFCQGCRVPGTKVPAGGCYESPSCAMFGGIDVAQALLPAASALLPTLAFDTVSRPRTGVEMSQSRHSRHECLRHIGLRSGRYAGEMPQMM